MCVLFPFSALLCFPSVCCSVPIVTLPFFPSISLFTHFLLNLFFEFLVLVIIFSVLNFPLVLFSRDNFHFSTEILSLVFYFLECINIKHVTISLVNWSPRVYFCRFYYLCRFSIMSLCLLMCLVTFGCVQDIILPKLFIEIIRMMLSTSRDVVRFLLPDA